MRSMRLASVPCTYYNETNASVCGAIRDRYNAAGGPNGPLGFPTSNELTNPDGVGKRTTFQGATSIYWTPATGAHDVRGALRDAWARNGWETGPMGYPVSDQIAIATGDGRTNRFFKNTSYAAGTPTRNTAAIYWSPATNAWAVRGPIWDRYSALGGATSKIGYPITDQVANNSGRYQTAGTDRNEFEQGWIFLKDGRGLLASWQSDEPGPSGFAMPSSVGASDGVTREQAVPTQQPVGNDRCPPDSTNPPIGKEPFKCLALITAQDGVESFIREGRPRPQPGGGVDTGTTAAGAFGRAHARNDHQVGLKAVMKIILDGSPRFNLANPRSQDLDRWEHTLVLAYEGDPSRPLEGVRAIVQREPDETGQSPDPGGLGLITAFCNDGSPGGPGGAVHPGGVCPRDLPQGMGVANGGE